jgi:hypothetical protein
MKYGTNHWHTISTEEQGFFLDLLHTQNQKKEKKLKPCEKQCNSLQGCIVMPIKAIGK